MSGKPVQSPWQPELQGACVVLWMPDSSGVGTTGGFGGVWSAAGTVAEVTPTNGGPKRITQMRRTRFSSVVTTADQAVGLCFYSAKEAQFWIGDTATYGGFYFMARINLSNWTTNNRLFAGLAATTTHLVISDTVGVSACGLWHAAGDADNQTYILTCDGATATKTLISGIGNLQDALGFDFHMWCKPNGSTLYWRLDSLNDGTLINSGSVTATLPTNSTFVGPQVAMSNAANAGAGDAGLEVGKIFVSAEI